MAKHDGRTLTTSFEGAARDNNVFFWRRMRRVQHGVSPVVLFRWAPLRWAARL